MPFAASPITCLSAGAKRMTTPRSLCVREEALRCNLLFVSRRNEKDERAQELVYEKLPSDIASRYVLLLDPVLGTGVTACRVIKVRERKQTACVFLLCCVSAFRFVLLLDPVLGVSVCQVIKVKEQTAVQPFIQFNFIASASCCCGTLGTGVIIP
eukprot:1156630-Pelagomonas_calceolata.AAC.5